MLSESAPAKLNLGLHVLRRRADGFHGLDTVFVPLGWADRLTAAPAPAISLTTTDPDLPTDDGNLVVRAARALARWGGVETGARLHLDKRVPYGAGLGGGSSDAAATLRLLAVLWDLDVPADALAALALDLGSDVPFFLAGHPARATGQGEQLTPLLDADGTPYRCPFWFVVAVPAVHVGTAEAYGLVTPHDGDRPALAEVVRSNDLERWRADLVNDFQAPVEGAHPEIAAVRQSLAEGGAGFTSLSGSGSAVFGAFESETSARAAAARVQVGGVALSRIWVEPPAPPA